MTDQTVKQTYVSISYSEFKKLVDITTEEMEKENSSDFPEAFYRMFKIVSRGPITPRGNIILMFNSEQDKMWFLLGHS